MYPTSELWISVVTLQISNPMPKPHQLDHSWWPPERQHSPDPTIRVIPWGHPSPVRESIRSCARKLSSVQSLDYTIVIDYSSISESIQNLALLHPTQNMALQSDITSYCHATGHQGDLANGPCEPFCHHQSLFTKRVNKFLTKDMSLLTSLSILKNHSSRIIVQDIIIRQETRGISAMGSWRS